jgi:hypothetical protein
LGEPKKIILIFIRQDYRGEATMIRDMGLVCIAIELNGRFPIPQGIVDLKDLGNFRVHFR